MSFTRAIRDALAVVADALIPVEVADLAEWLADQAEMLAKAKERREVWEPGEIEPGEIEPGEIDFTAAGLAAARAVRDAFTIVGEVIDALIPAEAIDQAEALAKAEEEREVWEPGEIDFAACGGDADAGSSHPTSAPPAKQDTAPHTDSAAAPHRGTPGGETPHSAAGHPDPSPAETPVQRTAGGEGPGADSSIPSGATPGHLTSYDASWAAAIVQSRGLDLPLGSRTRAAVMSLAERLQVLAKELSQ